MLPPNVTSPRVTDNWNLGLDLRLGLRLGLGLVLIRLYFSTRSLTVPYYSRQHLGPFRNFLSLDVVGSSRSPAWTLGHHYRFMHTFELPGLSQVNLEMKLEVLPSISPRPQIKLFSFFKDGFRLPRYYHILLQIFRVASIPIIPL